MDKTKYVKCAGAIVMSSKIEDPIVKPLKIIDVEVYRNSWGRQIDSFSENITLKFSKTTYKKHFRNHALIFIIKLFFISMFICFFIFNLSIPNYKIFIVSGYVNFTIFHIIEGFLCRKILLENEIKN